MEIPCVGLLFRMGLNNNRAIRILHANANTLIRNGLRALVSKGGGIEELKAVSTERDLFHVYESEGDWNLIIIDPHKENGFGPNTIHKLKLNYPEARILVISDVGDEETVLRLLEKGTHGYLTYECDEDEIIHAIFSIAKGEKFYCNKVLDIVLNKHLYVKEQESCEPTTLSERETEIAQLLAKGNTNKVVAELLHISPHTVHTHRKNIMKKLGVRSISELTIYCVSIGLVEA